MALIHYLNEYFDTYTKKNIESLEVSELLEILKDFKEEEIRINKKASASSIFSSEDDDKVEKRFSTTTSRIDRAIEATSKLKNLKGIPLLVKWIDVLKENGYWEDSKPILELTNRYGPRVLDIYVKHDEEAPAFIRKGIDF